jgi:hypothetical protein
MIMNGSRLHLSALFAAALLVAACGSASVSSPSAPPAGIKTTASTSPSATPAPTATPLSPDILFDRGIAESPAWQSFHLKVALSGTLKASFLRTLGNSAWAKLSDDAVLDGTVIEGDVDAQNLAFALSMAAPAGPLFGPAFKGDLIIKDSYLYLKIPTLGAKYYKVKLGTFSKDLGLPVTIPSPGPAALTDLSHLTGDLRNHLESLGVSPTSAGTENIGGRAAYRINLTFPLDVINSDLASAIASMPAAEAAAKSTLAGIKIDNLTSSIWIYTDNYQLAQVQIAAQAESVGDLNFTMTLTNFDVPVQITAPPASQVE